MVKNTITIAVSITEETRKLLIEWAEADERPVSYIVRKLILEEEKRLKKQTKKQQKQED